jgi:hypothetical protein
MAYDEDLADRVRDALPSDTDVTERKMFGGLAFLLNGHMFVGIVGNQLMVRLGHEAAQRALGRDHVREMDFTGRPMKNMIFVQPAGLHGPALGQWITAATDHARTMPTKTPRHRLRRPATDEDCPELGSWTVPGSSSCQTTTRSAAPPSTTTCMRASPHWPDGPRAWNPRCWRPRWPATPT